MSGDVQVVMEPAFLGKEATALALGGISIRKLDEFVRAGDINPQVIAGRVVFTPEEIRRFAATMPAWEPRQ